MRNESDHYRPAVINCLRQYPAEMDLVFRGGKLSRKFGDWNNVIDHCLMVAAGTDVLVDMMGVFSNAEKNALVRAALCHDWNQRLTKKPADFSEAEKQTADKMFSSANPSAFLMDATAPGFSQQVLTGKPSVAQIVLFYVDDITRESEIVPLMDRIDEVEKRRLDLGREFWDRERQAGQLAEHRIFELIDPMIYLPHPNQLPLVLRNEVIKRFG